VGIFRELSCFGGLRIWFEGLRVGFVVRVWVVWEFSGNFQGIFRELSGNGVVLGV
jgi:hypothetical protein